MNKVLLSTVFAVITASVVNAGLVTIDFDSYKKADGTVVSFASSDFIFEQYKAQYGLTITTAPEKRAAIFDTNALPTEDPDLLTPVLDPRTGKMIDLNFVAIINETKLPDPTPAIMPAGGSFSSCGKRP